MIRKLIEEITKKNAPVVVGLDPMLGYFHKKIKKDHYEKIAETLEGAH